MRIPERELLLSDRSGPGSGRGSVAPPNRLTLEAVMERAGAYRRATAYVLSDDGTMVPVEGCHVVMRTDSGEAVTLVTSRYGLVGHDEVLRRLDTAITAAGLSYDLLEVDFSCNDRRMAIFLRIPEITVRGPDGSEVVLGLLVRNSVDGSCSLRIRIGGFRSICLNMMVSGHELLDYQERHLTGIHGQLDAFVSTLSRRLRTADGILEASLAPFHRPFPHGVTATEVTEHVAKTLQLPRIMTPTPEEADEASTPWELLNAFTYAITHRSRAGLERQARFLGRIHTHLQHWT